MLLCEPTSLPVVTLVPSLTTAHDPLPRVLPRWYPPTSLLRKERAPAKRVCCPHPWSSLSHSLSEGIVYYYKYLMYVVDGSCTITGKTVFRHLIPLLTRTRFVKFFICFPEIVKIAPLHQQIFENLLKPPKTGVRSVTLCKGTTPVCAYGVWELNKGGCAELLG